MFGKSAKVLYASRFQPPLQGVGGIRPVETSMFDVPTPEKRKVKKRGDDQTDAVEGVVLQPNDNAPETSANSSVTSSPNKTLAANKTGRIQFENIFIPPEAPKDLLCEECEKEFAVFYCGACMEVYCFRCCDLCHPRISVQELKHPHERDGRIRGLIYGDTSRVNNSLQEEDQSPFHPPDEWCFAEDYKQDLSKPNSLSTSQAQREHDSRMHSSIAESRERLQEVLSKSTSSSQSPQRSRLGPTQQQEQLSSMISIANSNQVNGRDDTRTMMMTQPPKYSVKQLVMFTDPVTQRPSYGCVISQWDYTHGQSAPAIVRGEGSAVHYYVQLLGSLVDTEDLESLLQTYNTKYAVDLKEVDAERQRKHNPSVYDSSQRMAKEVSDDVLRVSRALGRQLTRRIKELQNVLALGPKYHMRDITESRKPRNNTKNAIPSIAESYDNESDDASTWSASQSNEEMITNNRLEGVQNPLRHHNNVLRGWQASKLAEFHEQIAIPSALPDGTQPLDSKIRTQADRRQARRQEQLRELKAYRQEHQEEEGHAAFVHNTNADDKQPVFLFGKIDEQTTPVDGLMGINKEEQDQRLIAHVPKPSVKSELYDGLDLSLYADIDIDNESLLSQFNANQRPLPAALRSYQHFVRDQSIVSHSQRMIASIEKLQPTGPEQAPISLLPSQIALANKNDNQHLNHQKIQKSDQSVASVLTSETSTPNHVELRAEADVQHQLLNVLILAEHEIESVQARVDFYKARQRMLLEQALNKNDFIWLKTQMILKFRLWKRSVAELRIRKHHFYARRIQSIARMWLCRNALEDMRKYWSDLRESQRMEVHSRFRYAERDDAFAVSFNNKLFFRTLADMNRYSAFLRMCCDRVGRYFAKKRSVLMQQAMRRWKEAIDEFLESEMKNNHIQTDLFMTEDGEAVDDNLLQWSGSEIEQQKQKIIDHHQRLVEYISPLYRNVMQPAPTARMASPSRMGIAERQVPLSTDPISRQQSIPDMNPSTVPPTRGQRLYNSSLFDEFSHESLSSMPLRIQPIHESMQAHQQAHGKGDQDDQSLVDSEADSLSGSKLSPDARAKFAAAEAMKGFRSQNASVPSYDPSFSFDSLPPLVKLTRPKTFRDRLYFDLQQDLPLLPVALRKECKDAMDSDTKHSSFPFISESVSGNDSIASSNSSVTSTTSVSVSKDIDSKTKSSVQSSSTVTAVNAFKSLMSGPTLQSYWMFPDLLLVGNAPLGPAKHYEFDVFDQALLLTELQQDLAARGKDPSQLSKGNLFAAPEEKNGIKTSKSQLSAIAALLLVGVNVFVTSMSDEEESQLLHLHDETLTRCKCPSPLMGKSLLQRVKAELKDVRTVAHKIIGDYAQLIRKQQMKLSKIPRFGKTDPRYANAHRELMRCEARISLARANIVKIRQQILRLPKKVSVIRLPICESALPWTRDSVLPSVWMLEHLLLHKDEDIPSNVSVQPSSATGELGTEDRVGDIGSDVIEDDEDTDDLAKLMSALADSNPVVDESLQRNVNQQEYRDSPNVFFETKISQTRQANVYYLFAGGPGGLAEDGVTKDGRMGMLASLALGRLYRLNSLEVLYRWQRAHDAMSIYSEPHEDKRQINRFCNSFKTPIPPLPWMRNLVIDVLQFSHRALAPVNYRMRYDPDVLTIASEEREYDPDGHLKINNLNFDHRSIYDETDKHALQTFNRGVVQRSDGATQSLVGSTHSSAEGMEDTKEQEDLIQHILTDKEYVPDFVNEAPRYKQSVYFAPTLK